VIYLSTSFTLGLLVSCLTPRPTTSLMLCLFLWIVLVFGIPNLMPMAARSLRPIPSEGKSPPRSSRRRVNRELG